jgi:hypothetical protein
MSGLQTEMFCLDREGGVSSLSTAGPHMFSRWFLIGLRVRGAWAAAERLTPERMGAAPVPLHSMERMGITRLLQEA